MALTEEEDQRSSSVGSGPGKCQPPCGLGLGDAFQFPKENLRCFVGISSTRGQYSSKDAWRSRFRPFRPFLPVSKWSCLLPRIVLQAALGEVTQIYPPLKLRVFVDDITALVKGK